ncbi:DNA-binding response regulator [Clostridium sp. AF19-22AC]|jgi:DNA-binding LytR/AlgR family response regulator|uniref:Stage 0 sporulation protein A homolog n=1 Tax=Faecalicatena orotica TaxID=1544 RepID=A0A2Y9CA04_9FIRM|nr:MULTISPECIES: LytTR family DNA-binding domain-containing protein [Clostridia]PWJ29266.1 LytTR family two component transcriptional regulator [Faecalicatena orotica]RHR24816.1 DNA-binding response regulator [Clostridium sp. AF19-22AC]SSA55719.1 two component transcriptional regulator, LytTR family [Faecalicatena orotica]
MLHIAICDDEQKFTEQLHELLKHYEQEAGELFRITTFCDGSELIDHYDTTIDLIFLDIKMNKMNGFKTAELIRQKDSQVSIIFLTTLTQYGLEGYKYQATNYIIKPMKYARLKSEMDRWIETHRKNDVSSIIVTNDTGKYKIPLKSLRYVETFNRNLLLHTEDENIVCYKSMKEMEQELCDYSFARCHTSYIVNLFYIKGVKKLEVELITGQKLPISQPKRKSFMDQLTQYWGDML